MTNGIVKVREEYLEEANKEAEELVRENYAYFKNKLTGFVTSSTIGIEIYKEVLQEEISCILAIEKSITNLDGEVIKEEEIKSPTQFDVKELISKYENVLRESSDEEEKRKTHHHFSGP